MDDVENDMKLIPQNVLVGYNNNYDNTYSVNNHSVNNHFVNSRYMSWTTNYKEEERNTSIIEYPFNDNKYKLVKITRVNECSPLADTLYPMYYLHEVVIMILNDKTKPHMKAKQFVNAIHNMSGLYALADHLDNYICEFNVIIEFLRVFNKEDECKARGVSIDNKHLDVLWSIFTFDGIQGRKYLEEYILMCKERGIVPNVDMCKNLIEFAMTVVEIKEFEEVLIKNPKNCVQNIAYLLQEDSNKTIQKNNKKEYRIAKEIICSRILSKMQIADMFGFWCEIGAYMTILKWMAKCHKVWMKTPIKLLETASKEVLDLLIEKKTMNDVILIRYTKTYDQYLKIAERDVNALNDSCHRTDSHCINTFASRYMCDFVLIDIFPEETISHINDHLTFLISRF